MDIRDDLKAYLDGELLPERRALVERAVAQDPLLRSELEQLRAIRATLRATGAPATVGLDRTLQALERGPAPVRGPGSPRWLPILASGLGVAAVAFGVWTLSRSMLASESAGGTAASAPPRPVSRKMRGALEGPRGENELIGAAMTPAATPDWVVYGDLPDVTAGKAVQAIEKIGGRLDARLGRDEAGAVVVAFQIPSHRNGEVEEALAALGAVERGAGKRSPLENILTESDVATPGLKKPERGRAANIADLHRRKEAAFGAESKTAAADWRRVVVRVAPARVTRAASGVAGEGATGTPSALGAP